MSARQYPRQPAISSHIYSLHSSFSVGSVHFTGFVRLYVSVAWLQFMYSISVVVVVAVFLMFFYRFSLCFVVRSLNHTQSIGCACVCMFGCMGFVLVRVHLAARIHVLFLKRYVGVFAARGSACCVPSCFPASVSTWLCAGCPLATPPQPEKQPRCPAPSGRFASGCF